jgi:hypothetical protein
MIKMVLSMMRICEFFKKWKRYDYWTLWKNDKLELDWIFDVIYDREKHGMTESKML